MKKVGIIILGLIAGMQFLNSQNPVATVKPYGYVAYELIYDTYKSVDSRDGELYLYPQRRLLDKNEKDINSKPYLQMLSLQARFGFSMTGPDIGSAKTSALLEADFYGTDNSYVNMVRLRHAWFKFSWEKYELLLGQASHPAINADCTPSPLSFGSGAPYHPLNRCVQARFYFKPVSYFKISLAALMGSTHVSSGPRDAQRRSGIPEFQLQAQFGTAEKFTAGVTAGYKFLSVLDSTRLGYKVNNRTGSYNLQAFARVTMPKFLIKAQVNYGTNLTNLSFIGGYGVKAGSEDPSTGEIEFTNLKTVTSWMDMETKFSKYNFGLFGGYSQTLGCEDDLDLSTKYMLGLFYNKNADLSYIFRISPRFFIKNNNLLYGIEWGINGAAYATAYNSKRKATKTDDLVYNNRIQILVKYNF